MRRKRTRFTCACCKRRRGAARLGGFMGKLLPVCEDCAARLEKARDETSTGGLAA